MDGHAHLARLASAHVTLAVLILVATACGAAAPRPTTLTSAAGVGAPTRETPRVMTARPISEATQQARAWQEYVRAIELDPDRPDAWYDLALLYATTPPAMSTDLECAQTLFEAFLARAHDAPPLASQIAHARHMAHPNISRLDAMRAMASIPDATGLTPPPPPALEPPPLPTISSLPTCPSVPPYEPWRTANAEAPAHTVGAATDRMRFLNCGPLTRSFEPRCL